MCIITSMHCTKEKHFMCNFELLLTFPVLVSRITDVTVEFLDKLFIVDNALVSDCSSAAVVLQLFITVVLPQNADDSTAYS